VQIKIGDYAFTTLRPVPALTRIRGVLVQLVEIPGLIEGAAEDRGGGRALLGVLRGADAVVYCQDVSAPLEALHAVRREVAAAGIDLPAILAATKADDAPPAALDALRSAVTDLEVVAVSSIDDQLLESFKEELWKLTGLVRVFLAQRGQTEDEPIALEPGSTVSDVARSIHKELAESALGARIWGPSARFPGQQVGKLHEIQDGDTVEILA
jgi:ribosome-interacting GTPase 1